MRTRRILAVGTAIGIALTCGVPLFAQSSGSVAGGERIHAATEGATSPYRHPPLAPDKALSGAALLAALRGGGHVLYMRHTQTGTITPQCTASNLTPAGERDARFIGESLRKLRIPIDRVLTSPVCRVLDSAKLLELGTPETTQDLSNMPLPAGFDLATARSRRVASMPSPGANTMLAGHMHAGLDERTWMSLDFGEIIVYRPDGKGGSEALARIRADDWYDLMQLDAQSGTRIANRTEAANKP